MVESLEDRRLLSVIPVTTTNQEVDSNADTSLQEAIFAANFDRSLAIDPVHLTMFITTAAVPGSGADTIVLQAGATYQVSGIVQNQYNPVGLSVNPNVFSTITIEGNGATLELVGGQNLRAFVVNDLFAAFTLPDGTVIPGGTGNLTLRNLHIKDFRAVGGDGADGGGGGLGAGAGVYVKQGTLTIENCTFENNSATGGAGGADAVTAGGGGGGGIGGDGGGEGIGGNFQGGGGGGGGRGDRWRGWRRCHWWQQRLHRRRQGRLCPAPAGRGTDQRRRRLRPG